MTAKLCRMLDLDGIILTQEGFGNPDTDLIMNCKKIEGKGVKTVIIPAENEPDLQEIDQTVRQQLHFVPVDHADAALDVALLRGELHETMPLPAAVPAAKGREPIRV